MNKLSVLVLGFLATAAVAAQASAAVSPGVTYYAEPSVVIAQPGDFDNAVGGALALGATIKNVHSIEVAVISFKTQAGDDFTFTPVLATYKYRVALSNRVSLTAGASVGATFEKAEGFTPGTYMGGAGGYSYSASQTAFTSGLVAGVSYAFNATVSLGVSAQVLRLKETDLTTAGNMALFHVGVNFRF